MVNDNNQENSPRRREMWLNLEIMNGDSTLIRSLLQLDLTDDEVAKVNAEQGNTVARQRLMMWEAEPGRKPPTVKFTWYRVTITDQFSGQVVHCLTINREDALRKTEGDA